MRRPDIDFPWMSHRPLRKIDSGVDHFAIAAKLAHPDKKVILLNGDSYFWFNVMTDPTVMSPASVIFYQALKME